MDIEIFVCEVNDHHHVGHKAQITTSPENAGGRRETGKRALVQVLLPSLDYQMVSKKAGGFRYNQHLGWLMCRPKCKRAQAFV